ncbi:unnamed protein product [Cyprideis torosa]|uniref:Uncharacterized protein n=1 Tax=Cyprideis torosa TaxID=163714 RepID=A0A7R8W448_9CRUS|nr:unnamed protein product [Cyprideis torosa]CAG0883767.1 unnamed protein product [Cyprideis torosa]
MALGEGDPALEQEVIGVLPCTSSIVRLQRWPSSIACSAMEKFRKISGLSVRPAFNTSDGEDCTTTSTTFIFGDGLSVMGTSSLGNFADDRRMRGWKKKCYPSLLMSSLSFCCFGCVGGRAGDVSCSDSQLTRRAVGGNSGSFDFSMDGNNNVDCFSCLEVIETGRRRSAKDVLPRDPKGRIVKPLRCGSTEYLFPPLLKRTRHRRHRDKRNKSFENVAKRAGIYRAIWEWKCKNSAKLKLLSIGRKKFNMDPKKGIEYLVEQELIQNNANSIGDFLYRGEGLNKTAIGDYLGEKHDFNISVLHSFVSLHNFKNLNLVQALRQFLWSFRLPGEAQKIDRMMECFAQHYCRENPAIFSKTDTCYVLSFAIIMLNTSLHNPNVKEKPSVEQFVRMNRGINEGGDLPRDLLVSLYESIKCEPFKIPEDDGNDLMHTFFNPDKEGWLWKQGGRYKSWKRRWFILNDKCLYYFEFTTDKEPRGIIPLENVQVREVQDRSKPNCFEIYTESQEVIKACKTDSDGKVVEGKHTVYRMSANTPSEQAEWMQCLSRSICRDPFYDMLASRKQKAKQKQMKTGSSSGTG